MSFYRQVEAGRRLVTPRFASETGMTEYYDPVRNSRFIHIPAGSEILGAHAQLSEARLATFSTLYGADGSAELIVPSGSLTIQQALKSIAMDLQAYEEIFFQIGKIIRKSEEAGFGAPSPITHRSLLAGIAFSPDDNSDYGSAVHFVPPYSFDTNMTLVDDLLMAREEMLKTDYFIDKDLVVQTLADVAMGYEQNA